MAMRLGNQTVPIPDPHGDGELDWTLVKRILVQAGIDAKQWNNL